METGWSSAPTIGTNGGGNAAYLNGLLLGGTSKDILFVNNLLEIQGRSIQEQFPNDLHFICGCSNFDAVDNHIFREVAKDHFRSCFQSNPKPSTRGETPAVLKLAHAKAQQLVNQQAGSANALPRFRIWQTNQRNSLTNQRIFLSESNWEDTTFVEVNDNTGLKYCLESPLRTALKQVAIEHAAQQSTNPDSSQAQTLLSDDEAFVFEAKTIEEVNDSAMEENFFLERASEEYNARLNHIYRIRNLGNQNPEEWDHTDDWACAFEALSIEEVNDSAMEENFTYDLFLERADSEEYNACLNHIYCDLGDQDPEEWARQLYLTLRDDHTDDWACKLNLCRKFCLCLLYDMVDTWETSDDAGFKDFVICRFGLDRLLRIVYVGLLMDRSQSLHCMRIDTSSYYGMHWYSKYHDTSWLGRYEGRATFNKRLYKIINTDCFGLLANEDIRKWSSPAFTTFVQMASPNPPLAVKSIVKHNEVLQQNQELQQNLREKEKEIERLRGLQTESCSEYCGTKKRKLNNCQESQQARDEG